MNEAERKNQQHFDTNICIGKDIPIKDQVVKTLTGCLHSPSWDTHVCKFNITAPDLYWYIGSTPARSAIQKNSTALYSPQGR